MKNDHVIKCDSCIREAILDEYSDYGYLYSQYDWIFYPKVKCPVCRYGIRKGTKLVLKCYSIYCERQDLNGSNT